MEEPMELQALGYFGIRARNLDDWTAFATRLLGFELVEKSGSTLTFRMDDRRQRVVVEADHDDGAAFFGWEVPDGTALDRLGARLEAAEVEVQRAPQALADARRVKALIRFRDPAGNRLEAFHGAEIAATPFKPGRALSGFRTGPLGMGHVVLHV
jgi:catechol 2,3-dioxygenase-like lactoylglutathione lyase family enzyme